jgi:1-acyl-sn-glycerol-3-phosphate acyltransferase
MAWLYTLNRLLTPAANLFIRGEVSGIENLPNSGPFIIAANHASFSAPWLIAWLVPQRTYRFVIVGRWFDRSRLWRAIFRACGTIPTSPDEPEGVLGRVLDAFDKDHAVVIFPEGRISHDGRIGRGKRGIARIAALSGIPVLPLGLCGNYELLPRDRRWPTWHRVSVRLGQPIVFPGSPFLAVGHGVDGAGPENLKLFTETVMSEIKRLAGQSSSRSAR